MEGWRVCVKVCVCVLVPWKNILQTRSLRGSYQGRGAGEQSAAAGVKPTSRYVYQPVRGLAVQRLIWRCYYAGYISDWHHRLRSTGPTAVPLCCFVKRNQFPTTLFSGKHHKFHISCSTVENLLELSLWQAKSVCFLMLLKAPFIQKLRTCQIYIPWLDSLLFSSKHPPFSVKMNPLQLILGSKNSSLYNIIISRVLWQDHFCASYITWVR